MINPLILRPWPCPMPLSSSLSIDLEASCNKPTCKAQDMLIQQNKLCNSQLHCFHVLNTSKLYMTNCNLLLICWSWQDVIVRLYIQGTTSTSSSKMKISSTFTSLSGKLTLTITFKASLASSVKHRLLLHGLGRSQDWSTYQILHHT